jgi:D-alanyl-lipoteichoic acid acyltransferase DltB (MBOAT superfamily)
MSFVDLGFWLALPVVLTGHYLTPARWRPAFLLAASLVYFALNSGFYVLMLVAAIGWSFAIVRQLARVEGDRRRQVLLLVGLLPVVGTLVLFKLGDALPGLILPLGISYYTFKLIAYLVEVYWDETQETAGLVDFAAYVSFAPQMVSGPIQRPADFMEQLPALRAGADRKRIEDGFRLLLDGLMLKLIIGDRLGAFVARIDADPAS